MRNMHKLAKNVVLFYIYNSQKYVHSILVWMRGWNCIWVGGLVMWSPCSARVHVKLEWVLNKTKPKIEGHEENELTLWWMGSWNLIFYYSPSASWFKRVLMTQPKCILLLCFLIVFFFFPNALFLNTNTYDGPIYTRCFFSCIRRQQEY